MTDKSLEVFEIELPISDTKWQNMELSLFDKESLIGDIIKTEPRNHIGEMIDVIKKDSGRLLQAVFTKIPVAVDFIKELSSDGKVRLVAQIPSDVRKGISLGILKFNQARKGGISPNISNAETGMFEKQLTLK